MGRVVAISGGDLQTTEQINKYAVKLSEKESPNVLFIGTASMDSEGYLAGIKAAFGKLNCNVKDLPLTKEELDDAEINTRLEWADVIYVGGGDTKTMMEIWKKYSLDIKLKDIYKNDTAVLMGLSAGAICWFSAGHSDSASFEGGDNWKYTIVGEMLGLFPYCFCPHYNEEGRDSFDHMISNTEYEGLALENEAAYVEKGGKQFIIGSRNATKAWLVSDNKKQELEVIHI
ncbi:peptidase E [Butyrivibrio fibrisolvens]|uniref:Type 1 glutamine amidotransferase-like domain-containing protein n=1 Tax=Pseudobutyrivibrio ruminis TaxID=46206 RepID=UPI00040FF3E5|nr:peptidase E [Pseudobutyrivibrio ruminis]MDC7279519.1 peptidase E [Butyrivibrio fibrisolvens]